MFVSFVLSWPRPTSVERDDKVSWSRQSVVRHHFLKTNRGVVLSPMPMHTNFLHNGLPCLVIRGEIDDLVYLDRVMPERDSSDGIRWFPWRASLQTQNTVRKPVGFTRQEARDP
jgi:hypothetical protein